MGWLISNDVAMLTIGTAKQATSKGSSVCAWDVIVIMRIKLLSS